MGSPSWKVNRCLFRKNRALKTPQFKRRKDELLLLPMHCSEVDELVLIWRAALGTTKLNYTDAPLTRRQYGGFPQAFSDRRQAWAKDPRNSASATRPAKVDPARRAHKHSVGLLLQRTLRGKSARTTVSTQENIRMCLNFAALRFHKTARIFV